MMRVLLAREFREGWRTWKTPVLLVVFLVTGLISPLLAKYIPLLLKAVPNLPAGLAEIIPPPTLADSIAQYLKNSVQFGILLVILLTMGAVVQEKERGTAAMLLAWPVSRQAVILAKWLAGMVVLLAGLVLGGLACLAYTAVLFEFLPPGPFLQMNLLLWVYLGVFLSLTILASTLARTQVMAAAGAFGGLVALLILGSLPGIRDYLPGKLVDWGSALVLKGDLSAWPALAGSVGIILAALGIACLSFRRQEI